jgi:predicted metal-binding protein
MDFQNLSYHGSSLCHSCSQSKPTTTTTSTQESTTAINKSTSSIDNLTLKQQVMINQFVCITGCRFEETVNLLETSNWNYQMALSIFFDDLPISCNNNQHSSLIQQNDNKITVTDNSNSNNSKSAKNEAPSNTPVTPPCFDQMEEAFAKLTPSSLSTNDQDSINYDASSTFNNAQLNSRMEALPSMDSANFIQQPISNKQHQHQQLQNEHFDFNNNINHINNNNYINRN